MNVSFLCTCCKQSFKSQRAKNCHISKSSWCQQQNINNNNDECNYNIINENQEDCVLPPIFQEDNIKNDEEVVFTRNCGPSLLQQAMDHEKNQAH